MSESRGNNPPEHFHFRHGDHLFPVPRSTTVWKRFWVVRTLLRRCLDKDPQTRLRDIGEARVVLQHPLQEEPPAAPPATRSARLPWLAAALFALAAASLAAIHFRESPPPAPSLRLTLLPPEKQDFGIWLALSPNSRLLAFKVRNVGGIWIRSLDSMQARLLAGTEGRIPSSGLRTAAFLRLRPAARLRRSRPPAGRRKRSAISPVACNWAAPGMPKG
jgi:hypothetical protein